MNKLIKNLQSLNAKERFFLIGKILGNSEFKLSAEFREDLNKEFDIKIPANVFSAMDYHLDWLYASLHITEDDSDKIYSNEEGIIKGHQEDIDYIIVFEIDNKTHIILIEAKGVTGWSNKQMDSKANRLKEIFGEMGDKWDNVIPHFLMMSPREQKKVNVNEWPTWMHKFKWLPLPIPEKLYKITRCNQQGKSDEKGVYWTKKNR